MDFLIYLHWDEATGARGPAVNDDEIRRLRERLAKFEAERDRLPIPFVEFDAENRFTGWNRAAEKLFGWTREEVLGRDPVGWFVPAEMEALMLESIERLKRGEETDHSAIPRTTKSGGLVVCDWYHTPWFDEHGVYVGRSAVGSDVTARVQAEDELKKTLARLPLALIRVDRELRILEWNPAAEALFGWTCEEARGRTITGLILPDVLPGEMAQIVKRLQSGDMHAHMINENLTKDGRVIVCEWFNTPHFDENGYQWTHGLATDITARIATEEELRDAMARLKVLSRRVIDVQEAERRHIARELHDGIGGVLTAIAVNVHAVRNGADPARLDICVGEMERTVAQVHDMALNLRPPMLDLLGLPATLRWLVSRNCDMAGFTAHVEIQVEDPLSDDLSTACYRIAQEALTNVIRHARAKEVWVSLRQDAQSVVLSVRDDGVGFDREREVGDSALGLLGIRERVDLFGGKLEIDSMPGAGTGVHAWFPLGPIAQSEAG